MNTISQNQKILYNVVLYSLFMFLSYETREIKKGKNKATIYIFFYVYILYRES